MPGMEDVEVRVGMAPGADHTVLVLPSAAPLWRGGGPAATPWRQAVARKGTVLGSFSGSKVQAFCWRPWGAFGQGRFRLRDEETLWRKSPT